MEEMGERCLLRQLATGESHTLALTATGAVYAWGRGLFGRLGTGKEADELKPALVPGLESHVIVSIAAGAYHSLALTDGGDVWSWGYNAYGQLGRDNGLNSHACLMDFHFPGPSKIASVAAGAMISCAIDEAGFLWTWGQCPPQEIPVTIPKQVTALIGKRVLKVACGNDHVLALTSSAIAGLGCYAWGHNYHGQLGLGDLEKRHLPTLVDCKQGSPSHVSCGAFHSALLMEQGERRSCWTFGLGQNGQLGHGTTTSLSSPKQVDLPTALAVECGLFHTCCVTKDGNIWVWGMESGLGLCPGAVITQGDAFEPIKFSSVNAAKLKGIVCGAAHTALLTEDGRGILAWGRGQHGVLGNGSQADSMTPSLVAWPPAELEGDAGADESKNFKSNCCEIVQKSLTEAVRENQELREQISGLKQRVELLEAGIYGGDDTSLLREWEKHIDKAGPYDLVKLESLYRRLRGHVKDTILRKKIEKWCMSFKSKEHLGLEQPEAPGASKAEEMASGSYSMDELKELSRRLTQMW